MGKGGGGAKGKEEGGRQTRQGNKKGRGGKAIKREREARHP